ncbi:hypothetical protein [Roseibium aggregatum]|uniref:Uncharacterized protein n=1 Tax=Roseibium aggregatum TaxID=187304 RepID=A0A0M6Y9P1_9HYPH|nr:hypothetical protein [Roseibium aggregatum]CTQ45721.1 hypothetical protein LAL4801_04176 [Roseibium aggregatum]
MSKCAEHLFFISETLAATPRDGECIVDKYWVIHPEKGLAFFYPLSGPYRGDPPAPQFNRSEATAKALCDRVYGEGFTVKYVPVVFAAWALREASRLKSGKPERLEVEL